MNTDIQLYIRCMEEVKLRDRIIEQLMRSIITTGQPMVDLEITCLQFRKLGELILLSALCAHRQAYVREHKRIEKEWEAGRIRRVLEKIHPEFYPIPFKRIVSGGKTTNRRLLDGFLTKDECISMIGQCSVALHGFNPYNDSNLLPHLERLRSDFPNWQKRIRLLLCTHEIKLHGTDTQLWVYMADKLRGHVRVEERVPIVSVSKTIRKARS